MKELTQNFKTIYRQERWLLALMIINLILAIALVVFVIAHLNPSGSVIKIGYGDIGGYRDGAWTDLLAFVILAIIFGIFHNFIAIRIFNKRGAGMSKLFLMITTTLIVGTFIVLARLTGEG